MDNIILNAKNKTFYNNGDKAKYTGKTENKCNCIWYVCKYLEGHRKGETFVTSRDPDTGERKI